MGLLVTVPIWALFVALAVWLPARAGRFGFTVFVLTLTCKEIPLVLLAVSDAPPLLIVHGAKDTALPPGRHAPWLNRCARSRDRQSSTPSCRTHSTVSTCSPP